MLLGAGLAFVTVVYAGMGVGYQGLQRACYDSRHSIDHEPAVGGGAIGLVIDVVLWPLFLPFSGQQSCLPVPLGNPGAVQPSMR